MQKRVAALLLALCLTLTCALGALAEGPDDQELAQTVEEKAPEQGADTIDGEADEELSMSVTVDGETEQNTVAVKEQDGTVPTPAQAGGETGQDAIAGEVRSDADENANQDGPDTQDTFDYQEWKEQTLKALEEADFSALWGDMTIQTNLDREVWYVGEPIVFIVSFANQPWLTENDADVYQYLSRTLTEKTQNTLAITTVEDWYKDGDRILHTMYQGARPTDKKIDSLQDFRYYGWGTSDFYCAFGCTPMEAGEYRLEVQSTAEGDIKDGLPFIDNMDELKAAKMPGGSIAFTVVERPEVSPNVPKADQGVAFPEAAQQAVEDAFNNAANTEPELDDVIRENATSTLTTELTIAEAKDPFAIPDGSDGTIEYEYKDISIQVKANGASSIYDIRETLAPIEFAFEKPAGPIVLVWRKHVTNDTEEVKRLPCWVDGDKVHFESDKFSTFAIGSTTEIAYADIRVADQTYTGNAIKPDVTVYINRDQKLTPGVDYEVVDYKDNVGPGTATVEIKGINSYTGTATAQFIIKPAPTGSDTHKEEKTPAAEETDEDETTPVSAPATPVYTGTIPQTADEFPLVGAVAVFGLSLTGLGALLLLRKKQR